GLGSQSVETARAEAGARSACTQARRAAWSDLEAPHALRCGSPISGRKRLSRKESTHQKRSLIPTFAHACPRRRVIFTQGSPRVRHEHALGMLGPCLDEIDPLLVRRCASGIAVVQPSARLANHRGSHKEALGVYAVVTPGLIWLSCSSKVRA